MTTYETFIELLQRSEISSIMGAALTAWTFTFSTAASAIETDIRVSSSGFSSHHAALLMALRANSADHHSSSRILMHRARYNNRPHDVQKLPSRPRSGLP
jgi:hypothetical protein